MEVIGTASALAHLLELSIKASKAAKSLVQSFLNAPEELVQLATKLDHLRSRIEQLHRLEEELPVSNSLVLLPPEHQTILSSGLQTNLDALQAIRSLCYTRSGASQTVQARLRWATLDKKRTDQILGRVAKAESQLNTVLVILGIRLTSLNHMSLQALSASHTLLQAELRESIEAVKLSIQTEIRSKQSKLDIGSLLSPNLAHEVEPATRLTEHHMRRSLWYYSLTYGGLREPSIGDKHKRTRRKLRFVVEIGFNIFCQQVLQFELNLQQAARHWIGMPRFDCSVTLFNVRPQDASIFRACQGQDLSRIQYLLKSGQASIYDSNDEIGGLLEVIEHLLDLGCNPNMFYGTITEKRLPAILFAFDRGYSSTVSAMLSRGADIISFGPILAGLLQKLNAGFKWKVQLLRSVGYSDWKVELPNASRLSNTLLHGACEDRNFQEVLFALEIAQIDPNSEGEHRRTPLGHAASWGRFLKGVVVLVESGAEVNPNIASRNGTPLVQSLGRIDQRGFWRGYWLNDTTHYLLLQGASPHLRYEAGKNAWQLIWNLPWYGIGRWPRRLSFISLEGGLAHLLLHGSDPFRVFLDPAFLNQRSGLRNTTHDTYDRYASKLNLRALETGRSWSYGPVRWRKNAKEWLSKFEHCEETRKPRLDISWSPRGMIYQNRWAGDPQYAQGAEAVGDGTPSDVDHSGGGSGDDTEDEDEHTTFFQHQTQFYHHISSPEGQRLLSRFPVVLALCDALQFAGYRAEMDDDGDIWYEAGDGDRYFDAREEQEEGDDRPTDFCPICQDFDKHGLGHILREAEEAKRELREYREKVKAASNNFW
ncbi:hypothetical protein F4820DRAFT_457939 [Hypoxylon rubiginosum]|uniref:Uncharacterized protein n=1 Tax=Hypoxylon rubiginosum TaxID=110542 RepID=A0ACB9Z2V1_9PEZI|nr:hypothetical protein F4820DRAFT_457939 [Hypoxylon rubiginosum]